LSYQPNTLTSLPDAWVSAESNTHDAESPMMSRETIGSVLYRRMAPSELLGSNNFATFIATANGKAPIAQRGKAKQKRSDLRLVGLGLVVTRDGGIPLTWHAYPATNPTSPSSPA
jgi:hypothetical protein